MRFSNEILVLVAASVVAAASIAGCSDETGSGSSGSGAAAGAGSGTFPCSPKSTCSAVDKDCLGLVDNNGKNSFGLRMSELVLSKPAALTAGIVKQTVSTAVTPNLADCNVVGGATFNWLFQFDTDAGTIKTGGAKPVMDPTTGYSFLNEMIGGQLVQPVTYMATPDGSGKFATDALDLIVPIFLDLTATQVILLPLRQARLVSGTLSDTQNCVGKYNAEGLDPALSCVSDSENPTFVTGAELDGHITLEDADAVEIAVLNQTLCVLLSGDATQFGDTSSPKKCKRTNGVIDFKGDWCTATNTAGGCQDSVALGAKFAASSILINN
jgi:hypothetical protein